MLHKLSKGIGTRKAIESPLKYTQIHLIILTYYVCCLYKILILDMSQLILSSSAVSVELMKIHGCMVAPPYKCVYLAIPDPENIMNNHVESC